MHTTNPDDLTVASAEAHLRRMLTAEGVDSVAPDFDRTWAVFKAFAVMPVRDSASDGLLFESGVYNFNGPVVERPDGSIGFAGPERFYVDSVRQLDVLTTTLVDTGGP